jgi:hypothetical protein
MSAPCHNSVAVLLETMLSEGQINNLIYCFNGDRGNVMNISKKIKKRKEMAEGRRYENNFFPFNSKKKFPRLYINVY